MKPAFHGRSRNTQNLHRLFHGHELHISQHQHLAIDGAERIDGLVNSNRDFIDFKGFRWYWPPIRKVFWGVVSVVNRLVKVRSGLSQFQFSFVASDLYESCAELRFPTKASEIRKGLQNCLLGDFFRVSRIF